MIGGEVESIHMVVDQQEHKSDCPSVGGRGFFWRIPTAGWVLTRDKVYRGQAIGRIVSLLANCPGY